MSRGPGRPQAAPNDRLVRALHRAQMTQADLATKMKISRQSVNYWCGIGVPASRVLTVAKILNVTPQYLRPDVFR